MEIIASAPRLVHKEIAKRATSLQQLGPLIDRISNARIVMLGEASHGTHEFYEWRRIITEILVSQHGFKSLCIEGDWPPCQKVNKFINAFTSPGKLASVHQLLSDSFKRWPTWMWANEEFGKMVEWMKRYNEKSSSQEAVQLFGLDIYSLFESIDVVLEELKKIDPKMAEKAKRHYACFDPFHPNEEEYLRSLIEIPEGCKQQAVKVLRDLLNERLDDFNAQQNARIVKNAENYYRVMISGDEDSWNVRERHMMETLDIVLDNKPGKMIVWAHNTHIGDYRETSMSKAGHVNIGGLVRDKYGQNAVALVGFGTYEGSVIASPRWSGPVLELQVPPAREGSYENIIHESAHHENLDSKGFYLMLDDAEARNSESSLAKWKGNRAIGIVYEPMKERWGNYVPTRLSRRYDHFVFIDSTRALHPLEVETETAGKVAETFPSGH